ncbi:hypothetical protein [Duganella sp. FT27W]|uniref:hypothetical protein n=1 Tax=Duganella sp. FT27W TaxID=2654636 RepID=UPI00128BCD57|nr:hypothetical protein [Duganella sp. FT27W]MPQ55469.1 hypothetical protein [Duganella sp. FT27W]
MSKLITSTQFLNISVKVKPGAVAGEYKVETAPSIPRITQPDTVINYQIVDTGGVDIVFTGMSVTPEDNNQLSAAIVSVSGKQLTFSDANSEKITLNVTLKFKAENQHEFAHDPQVENEPEPT